MPEIDDLRNKMDEITLKMMELLKTRTDIAKEIGEIKKNLGKGVTDEIREENLRTKVVSVCKEIGLNETIATKFLNFLLNESVKVQSSNKQTHLSIFLKAKTLEQQGKKIIHMEVGELDFLPPVIVKSALEEAYDKGYVRYGPAKGIPSLRTALAENVSKTYNINVNAENILVSPGARFSIFLAISTLLNPGDEVIVIEPAWPAYLDCALNAGVKVKGIKTTIESKWEPSIQQIENSIKSNTKMIVFNYPNNPTGKILPPKIQDEIVDLAIKNDLYIISDEIYSQYAFKDWKSVQRYQYKKSIVTQSFSKSHAMTGFRIGYATASPEIIDTMSKLQALSLTNVSEPIQYVALQALNENTSDFSKTIKSRLEVVAKKAKEIGLNFVEPDGAMYLFAKVNQDGFDGTEFANKMLEYGLAVAPGAGFGDYKDFIRISACQDEKTLMEGMDIIQNILRSKK